MERQAGVDPRIARTHRLVLDAAAQLVAECGVGGTTIEALADRSGVARSTIYRHWPERTELLLAAVERTVGEPVDIDSGTLRGDLVAVFSGLGRMLTSEPIGSIAASVIIESRRDPELAAIHARFTAARRGKVIGMIRRGMGRGELPATTDADEMAHEMAAPLFYRALVLRQPIDSGFVEDHVDRWLERYGATGSPPGAEAS